MDRRRLIGLISGSILFSFNFRSSQAAMPPASFLESPELARIAAAVGRQEGLTAKDLDVVAQRIYGHAASLSSRSALRALKMKAKTDFAAGKVLFCDGWMLSQTEAIGLWVLVEARRQGLHTY